MVASAEAVGLDSWLKGEGRACQVAAGKGLLRSEKYGSL